MTLKPSLKSETKGRGSRLQRTLDPSPPTPRSAAYPSGTPALKAITRKEALTAVRDEYESLKLLKESALNIGHNVQDWIANPKGVEGRFEVWDLTGNFVVTVRQAAL